MIDLTINDIDVFRINHSQKMSRANLSEELIHLLSKANESIINFARMSGINQTLDVEKVCTFFKYFYTQLRLFPYIKRRVLERLINTIKLTFTTESTVICKKCTTSSEMEISSNYEITEHEGFEVKCSKSSDSLSSQSKGIYNLKQLVSLEESEVGWSFIDCEIEKELIRRNIPIFSVNDDALLFN